jgi:hypothetical protein
MSNSTMVWTLAAVAGVAAVILAYSNIKRRGVDRLVVMPGAADHYVATAQPSNATRIAGASQRVMLSSPTREPAGPTAGAAGTPSLPGALLLTPPAQKPGYEIRDDSGNVMTLEQLRDNPQSVTLYLTRGAVQVPIRLDINANQSITDQVNAVLSTATTSLPQGATPVAPLGSPPMERALPQTPPMERSLTQDPVMQTVPRNMGQVAGMGEVSSGITGMPSMLSTGVPGVSTVPGLGRDMVPGYRRNMPYSYVQTFDANGNYGWMRVDRGVRRNGTYAPFGFDYTNPFVVTGPEVFAGDRAQDSFVTTQIQQGDFAGDRANQSDAANRAAVTVR